MLLLILSDQYDTSDMSRARFRALSFLLKMENPFTDDKFRLIETLAITSRSPLKTLAIIECTRAYRHDDLPNFITLDICISF